MSGYSRRKVAGCYVTELAGHNPKKASDLKNGEHHDEMASNHREIQNYPRAQQCASPTIKISNVCSLSDASFHFNSPVASSFEGSHLDPAGPTDLKLLSTSDVKPLSLDPHSAPESLSKSDCDVREVGTGIPENVSTTMDNHKGKNRNTSIFSDLTEKGSVSNEPNLAVTPTLSSPVSKFSRMKTRSVSYAKSAGVETHTRNSDAQKRSNSSVGHSIAPSENKSKPNTEENVENKSSDKNFCCVLGWTASIYGQQLQCPCALAQSATTQSQGYVPQSSTSVKQVALHIESYRNYVLIKDLDSSGSTVKKETTSPPKLNTRAQRKLPLEKRHASKGKSQVHNQNKEKRQTYFTRKKSELGIRKSQALELAEGENSNSKGNQESLINSVVQTCDESRANLLDRQEKAVLSHTPRNVSGQKTLTGLKNEYRKKLVQSEQSKCARNEGESQLEYKSLPCSDGSSHVPHSAKLSDDMTNEKTGKIQNNTYSTEFCCMLGWSAQVCGEKSKCSCSLVSSSNIEINEVTSPISPQSYKEKLPLFKDTKTWGTRSADDQSSSSPMKSEGKNPVKHIQEYWKSKEDISGNRSAVGKRKSPTSNNSEGKCESASDLENSTMHHMKANKRAGHERKQTNVPDNEKTRKPPSSESITDPQEPVHNLSCVTNTPDKQTLNKKQFIPSETTTSPDTLRTHSHNLRLHKQNISSVETSELPPSPRYRPKCCLFCDRTEPKRVEISKHDEITRALQDAKGNYEYGRCGQKLGNKDKLGHQGQKKRKSNVLGSQIGFAKRSKSAQSQQDVPVAEKKPLEIAALPTCDVAVKTPDASSRPKGEPSFEKKMNLKQCVLKLYRLPLPLDGKFYLDNSRETSKNCKVEGKVDTEQISEITCKELPELQLKEEEWDEQSTL